jgi:hypothetical protein
VLNKKKKKRRRRGGGGGEEVILMREHVSTSHGHLAFKLVFYRLRLQSYKL